MRVLRAFLGVTFVFAGIQKFMDRNFLRAGSPDYIGSQLRAFARGSPIHFLLAAAMHVPVLTGIAVALVEVAVGIGTLLGVGAFGAAAIALCISLALFLSATWHVHPYFLGSDSIYAVAWLAYLVGLLQAREERRRALRTQTARGSRRARASMDGREELRRREFIRAGVVGAATVALAGMGVILRGRPAGAGAAARRRAGNLASEPPPTSQPSSTQAPGAQGTPIASLDSIPVGGAVDFSDPALGPSVLVRLSGNRVAAFSRTCTHAGCLVQYDQGSHILYCPCHGAEFDPARDAEPIAGPAPFPLSPIRVTIDPRTGKVLRHS
jgi:thiosulfate dehydrogenase [quinone] large subunit